MKASSLILDYLNDILVAQHISAFSYGKRVTYLWNCTPNADVGSA
jgi:hypothetical protein